MCVVVVGKNQTAIRYVMGLILISSLDTFFQLCPMKDLHSMYALSRTLMLSGADIASDFVGSALLLVIGSELRLFGRITIRVL